MAFLSAMGWPLALCWIVGGLLTYLGQEALDRRAAFAELAVTQAAAFGALWGVLLGWRADADPWILRAFALAFASAAAGFFARPRSGPSGPPKEALAGIVYVLATAGSLLVAASLHHGAEDVAALVGGRALLVRPHDGAHAVLVCAPLAVLLQRLGRGAAGAGHAGAGSAPLAREIAFYGVLAAAASFAVPLVGALLVFAQLLVPPATGALLAETRARRLWIAWAACASGTLIGFALAYARDLPPEPAVVACLGLQFVLGAIVRYVRGARDRLGAVLAALCSTALVAILLAWSLQFRAREAVVDLAAPDAPSGARAELVARLALEPGLWESERTAIVGLLAGNDDEVRAELLELIGARGEIALLGEVHALLRDPQDLVRESALRCVAALGRPESVPVLIAAAGEEDDEFLRVEFAVVLLALGSDAAREVLLDVMEQGQIELARGEAHELLLEAWPESAAADPAFDAAGDPAARRAAVAGLRREPSGGRE